MLDRDAPISLEFAAATSELVTGKASVGLAVGREALRPFSIERDLYPWCDAEGSAPPRVWESSVVRAFLCAVRAMTRADRLAMRFLSGEASPPTIEIRPYTREVSRAAREAFDAIAVVGDLEWLVGDDAIVLASRHEREGNQR
jgi:hypothetical protein